MTLKIPGAELTGLNHLEHIKRLGNVTGSLQSTLSSRNPRVCPGELGKDNLELKLECEDYAKISK